MRSHRLVPALLVFTLGCSGAPRSDDQIAAWEAYCDRLKAAGIAALEDYPQNHEIDRDEALAYLASQVAYTVRDELIGEDPNFPLLRLGASTIDKWGLDGADVKYVGARIEGDASYRLHGRMGSAALIALQTFTMEPDYAAFASLSNDDLRPASDGSVDVLVSAEKPAEYRGVWLEVDPRATNLLVREYFNDWEKEVPSELYLERLDVPADPPAPQHEDRLERMATAFEKRVPMWLEMSSKVRSWVVNNFRGPPSATDQGLKDNVYGQGWFQISEDEALVIELEPPDATIWSFQLGNFWWESLDYVNRTGSLNGHQAFVNADGKVRIVVALEDPGVPNWLDPSGHPEGNILYRYQQSRTDPKPEAQLVDVAELREALPADTPSVTAQQRREEVAQRRHHAMRRWSP